MAKRKILKSPCLPLYKRGRNRSGGFKLSKRHNAKWIMRNKNMKNFV
jgi:hypothetical protein